MFWNKFLVAKIIGITAVVAVPAVAVGSYFAVSEQDKFRNYYLTPSNDNTRGFVDAYKNAVYNGSQAILAPGFTHKDPIIAAFNNYGDFFKNTGFLLYDEAMSADESAASNTWSITFRSDLGSIQCGVALGIFLNQYQDVFYSDQKLTYATYGGLPFSSVTSFMGGLQKGVDWFNNNLDKLNQIQGNNSLDKTRRIEYKPLEQIRASSKSEFAGGFGPGEGAGISQDIISQNVDAIMPVAGPQIWTVMDQIIKLKKKTIILGVDSAAEDDKLNKPIDFSSKYGPIGNGKYVQFSSMKDLASATVRALQIINNGNVAPANDDPNYFDQFVDETTRVGGFGTIAIGNIKNNCTGISPVGKQYLEFMLSSTNSTDPALNPTYSNPSNMYYNGVNIDGSANKMNYGEGPFGLKQKFESLNTQNPLKLENFITKNNQNDIDKIRICLSGSTSILIDGSFSQSCYNGLYEYYKQMGINIPSSVQTTTASLNDYISYYYVASKLNHSWKVING